MSRDYILLVTVTSLLLCCFGRAEGQISFGVTRQNGVVTGGGFIVGGFVTNGGTGVRLGISTGTRQLTGVQNFTFQNGSANVPGGVANTQNRRLPNPSQFVKAAAHFDADKDGLLDREELGKVAAAVMAELSQRQSPGNNAPATAPTEAEKKMVDTFVSRCLKFDKDGNEALNAAETKRMAIALIRSLS